MCCAKWYAGRFWPPISLHKPHERSKDDCGHARSSREAVPAIFENIRVRLFAHPLECIRAPGRNFALDQNSVTVALIEYAPVLLPVHARKHTVQFFEVVMVVLDIRAGSAMPNAGLLPAIRSTPIKRTRSPFK